MKKMLMIFALAMTGALFAQEQALTLADARAQIGAIVANPNEMTAVISQLSAADQTAFLADVNAAVAKMPGSAEEKAAKALDVNTAALKGAKKGNVSALVAEVFATATPEALTLINEKFAETLFNRASDASKAYTDDQFKAISLALLDKVQERLATADNAGVRNTFLILMMLRASNGTPADLRDAMVGALKDEDTKNLAQNEWISPAMGVGQEKNYDALLGAADAGRQPDVGVAMSVTFVQSGTALLGDLATSCNLADFSASQTAHLEPIFDSPLLGMTAAGSVAQPRFYVDPVDGQTKSTLNTDFKGNPRRRRGQVEPSNYP